MGMTSSAEARHVMGDVVRVSGRFRPNGSSAIDNSLNKGAGFTVAYISAGLYRVTFKKVGVELLAGAPALMLDAAADMTVQYGAYDPTNRTLDIRVQVAVVMTDIASHANNWISFWAEFQNTKVKKMVA